MLRRKIYALGLLTLVALLAFSFILPSTPAFANGYRPETAWSGTWQTSWSIMEYGVINTYTFTMNFTQSGGTVTGTSDYYGWSLNGTVSGNELTGHWSAPSQPPVWNPGTNMYSEAPHKWGTKFHVTMDPSGMSFRGLILLGPGDELDPATWDTRFVVTGTKAGYTPSVTPTPQPEPQPQPIPQPAPSGSKQFTGNWHTEWGDMTLTQVGDTLTGTYDYDGGRIQGTVDGTTATGTWSEAPSYQPPLDAGDFIFILSPDGRVIDGNWRYGSCDWDGDIRGTRGEQPEPSPSPAGSWSGNWSTNWGDMTLTQSGSTVTGTYAHDTGRITATVSGNALRGTWSEAPTYALPDDAGDVEFTMSADGQSFTGSWRYGSSGAWSGWTGDRLSTPTPKPAIPITTIPWGGTWNTDWGEMFLDQTGDQITGTYEYENGQIEGSCGGSGYVLTGTWSKAPSYAGPNDLGSFEFTISEDLMSFTGNWRYGSCDGWNGSWDGDLIEPDVIGVNHPPTASFYVIPQSPTTSDTVIASSTSTDPDGDTLSYSWSLDGVNASQYNNMPYFIRQYPTVGAHTIGLQVSDGRGGTSFFQAQVNVTQAQPIPSPPAPDTNQIPIASFSITPQVPTTSDTIIASSTSIDPDGDPLTYSWFRDGVQANECNNMSYCIWAKPTAGAHTISLSVSDGKGGTNSTQTQINVTQAQPQPTPGPIPGVNTPPKAYFVIEPPQPEAGDKIKIVSQSTDVDGDNLGFTWYLDGQQLGEYTDSSSWTWKKPEPGGHFMRLLVDDGRGGEDAYSKKIKIIGDAAPDSGGWPEITITLPQCFIATATYGSSTAEELDILRAFRDEVLLQSEPGRAFVELYYKTSPPVADFIASNEALRTVVRELMLDPIVLLVKHTQCFWNSEAGTK